MNTKASGGDTPPCIVQFQHRKDEFSIDRCDARRVDLFPVRWNRGGHRRRLVGHYGEFVKGGACDKGELSFWTEWEANTLARNLSPLSYCGCAKRIHYVESPLCGDASSEKEVQGGTVDCTGDASKYLNTDPCVFGKSFKYSNCKQNATYALKNLPPGSLIIFGSIHETRYYLDTVFVVADGPIVYETSLTGIRHVQCSPEYKELTFKRLLSTSPQEFAFYRGRVFEKGGKLPFSFTPAYKFSSNDRKSAIYNSEVNSAQCRKRCVIDLSKLNDIAMKYGSPRDAFDIKRTRPTTVTRSNPECIESVWNEIVIQVQSDTNGMVLGTYFDWPEQTH